MLKRVASSLYGGGSDTTASANSSFFLLMSLHPEIQRKAQEEIDRVIGHDRLPNAQDRKDLPYVNAIMREVMRLNPVVPLGEDQCKVLLSLLTCALAFPHRLKEDDVYGGMLLSEVVTKSLDKGQVTTSRKTQYSMPTTGISSTMKPCILTPLRSTLTASCNPQRTNRQRSSEIHSHTRLVMVGGSVLVCTSLWTACSSRLRCRLPL